MFLHRNFAPNLRLIKMLFSSRFQRSKGGTDGRILKRKQSDKINREHYKKPRSSSAEEALLVYLINNPDYANSISERVTPDKFSNSLIKRYYEYVLSKIKSGYEPLTSVSSDFNSDEVSYLYKLISTTIPAASTREAVEEYINVINEESNKLTSDKLADMSADDINDYIMKMKQNKK